MHRTSATVIVTILAAVAAAVGNCQEGALDQAVKNLRAPEAATVAGAVRTIAASKDAPAWRALGEALRDPKVLDVLEAPGRKLRADAKASLEPVPGYAEAFKVVSDVMNAVAKGDPELAFETLSGVLANELYALDYGDAEDDNRKLRGADTPWRRFMTTSAFKLIRAPSRDTLRLLDGVLNNLTEDPRCVECAKEALAAYGTAESAKMLENGPGIPFDMLAAYRDRYHNAKMMLDVLREATAQKIAHRELSYLFIDKHVEGGMITSNDRTYPEIRPAKDDALRFAVLFREFLADPGRMTLTDAEKENLRRLIKVMEELAEGKGEKARRFKYYDPDKEREDAPL